MLQAGAHGYVTKKSPYEEVFDAILHVHAGQQYICKEVQAAFPAFAYTRYLRQAAPCKTW
jgi:DNA-binding NarL/FixJ family response regulator